MIFFFIFFEIFLPGSGMNGIQEKIFFLPFSAYLREFGLKIMSERGFLIFLLFFLNFLVWVEYERNSGVKFFSLFLGLSHPVLAKNKVGKRFSIFSIFLLFFWNFLVWVKYERNSGVKLFSLFLGLSNPVLVKNNVGKRLDRKSVV